MKSPAFQFYPADYIGSQRVQMLTLEEEGAYIRLLCSCWQHGSIPADPEMAARIIGKGGSRVVAEVVLKLFIQHPSDPTLLTHERLEEERTKQAFWREKSSRGGLKSAQAKAKAHVKGGSTTLATKAQPKVNTPSPSSVFTLQDSILPPGKPGRARDGLFDALAQACGNDPLQMTASAARVCAVKMNEIKRAMPTVTAAEIQKRAAAYRKKYRDAALTPAALCAHWGNLGDSGHDNGPKSPGLYQEPAFDWQTAIREKWPLTDYPARQRWEEGSWSDVPLDRRAEILRSA